MIRLAFIYLSVLTVCLCPCRIMAQGREEFHGPFPSWADVKKRFGAHGNGKDDDTHALQVALDSLSCPPTGFNTGKAGYTVVYLPAGVYTISSTLVLKGKIGVNIIGEDPANTIIRWVGPEKNMMLWANGSAYFKISRITWDAGGRKGMEGIGIHWRDRWNDGRSMSFASLNIELSDNLFTGGFLYGISGGCPTGTNSNDSEIAIRRCTFYACSGAGIEINGFNALDYWIWDCRFLKCTCGVESNYGNYHVYRSYFSGSTSCDLHNTHGYYISARGCYSEGSRMFSADETVSSNPFKRIFQDNTIIHPSSLPILYYHLGKISLMGNRFTPSADPANKLILKTGSWATGTYEVLSLHNVYPYASPISVTSAPNQIFTLGDRQGMVTPSGQAFLKAMDPTPRLVKRRVFEVPLSADARTIQSIIDKAAALRGQRVVVHFGMGTWSLDRTLLIPPGADLQLEGDGMLYASVLSKAALWNLTSRSILLVKGPSAIAIRDLQLGREDDRRPSTAIIFEGVDQPGSRAFLDQLYSHADTTVALKKLDNLYVQKDNSFFTDGNYISRGKQQTGAAGLFCYGGGFTNVKVENNGRFLAKDCWWEGDVRIPLDLNGEGMVCIDGAMIAPNGADSATTVRIGRFNGHICLMNMYLEGAISALDANPGLNLLLWNVHFYYKMDPLDFLKKDAAYKAALLGLTVQCFTANNPICNDIHSIADRLQNISNAVTFLDAETAFDRDSRPLLPVNLGAGISNVCLSRVSMPSFGGSGLVFTAL